MASPDRLSCKRIASMPSTRREEIVRWMRLWGDAMQGARAAAVRALQGSGNATARRPEPQTLIISFGRVLTVTLFASPDALTLRQRAHGPDSSAVCCHAQHGLLAANQNMNKYGHKHYH
jgi:hypothetical protein